MTQDDGWHTVGAKTKKSSGGGHSGRRAGASGGNSRRMPSSSSGGPRRSRSGSGARRGPSNRGPNSKPVSYASASAPLRQQQHAPKNVVASSGGAKSGGASSYGMAAAVAGGNTSHHHHHSHQDASHQHSHQKKEAKPRKSLEEYSWTDLKQLRRIVAHLESIANYSKGGIIGSLRGKTIHNSEDREQDVTPISEIKINAQEDAFMRYIADYIDLEEARDPDTDTLLGFMTILLTCIAHTRHYNQEEQVDNYWNYHEKFSYNVWKGSMIPTTVHETILRELQEKLQHKPLAIDKDQLQLLLTGKEFEFKYPGNLSVPYCLNAIKEFVNCNQSKVVSQRRRLYRYEHRTHGTRSTNMSGERNEWHNVAYVSKDYRTQVEAFEKQYMQGDGAPVLGISSIDTVLHSIYTSFLKIRKRETPKDLLHRLKQLLLALPNLIDLPELLQRLNPGEKWCGYKNVESYPDLSDYQELKNSLEALLEREGIKKRSSSEDSVKETLESIYELNHSEEQKTVAYKKALDSGDLDQEDESSSVEKGYPLSPKYLKALLCQIQLTEEDLQKYDESIKKLSKLNGLTGIASSLKKRLSNDSGANRDDSDEEDAQNERQTVGGQFDQLAQMTTE